MPSRIAAYQSSGVSAAAQVGGRVLPDLQTYPGIKVREVFLRERGRGLAMQPEGGFWPIEDYGLIGNRHAAALVNSVGSINWLCWPRFDSPSIFAGILDPERGGNWVTQPTCDFKSRHRYLKDTNILETIFECPQGKVALLDFME